MPPKAEGSDKVPALKGSAAENKVLEYIKRCNRPYGSSDISANLQNAVSKAATQKILIQLAEKGEIAQKTYGKQTFFVAKQSELEDMPQDKINALTSELASVQENVKEITSQTKTLQTELTKLRNSPTDSSLSTCISTTEEQIARALEQLEPLRESQQLVSAEEDSQLDSEWVLWRAHWVARRKMYKEIWSRIADNLTPAEAEGLIDSLGIELDSIEHIELEKSPICSVSAAKPRGRR